MAKSGTNYTAKWTLDDEGVLTISPKSGTSGILRYSYEGNHTDWPWTEPMLSKYVGLTTDDVIRVTSIVFTGSIKFQFKDTLGDTTSYTDDWCMREFFGDFSNVTSINITGLVTSTIKDAKKMFALETLTKVTGTSNLVFSQSATDLSELFKDSKITELDISNINEVAINHAAITDMLTGMNYCEHVVLPDEFSRITTMGDNDSWIIYDLLGLANKEWYGWDATITATNANGITITTDKDFFKLPSGQQGGTWTRDISKSATLTASVNSATRSTNTATIGLTYACTRAEINVYAKKSSEADYPSDADLTQSIAGTGTLSLELELATDDAYDMQITVSDGTTNLYFFPSVDSNILLAEIDELGTLKVNNLTIGDYYHITPKYLENYSVTKSLASGSTWTDTGCTLTLDEGIWMVTAAVNFPNPSNGTGVSTRACRVYNNTKDKDCGYVSNDQKASRNDYIATCNVCFPYVISVNDAPTTLEIQAYQSSGKTLSTKPRLYAARIG